MKSKLLTVATTVAFLAGTGLAFAQAAGGGAAGGGAGGSVGMGTPSGGAATSGQTGNTGAGNTATGSTGTGASTLGSTSGSMGTSTTASSAQMQQQLTAQGYSNVTGLQPATGGGFSGQAVKNGQNVTVHVDSAGNVTSN